MVWMKQCFLFAGKKGSKNDPFKGLSLQVSTMVVWIIEAGQQTEGCYKVICYDYLFRSLPEVLVYSDIFPPNGEILRKHDVIVAFKDAGSDSPTSIVEYAKEGW
jgi:hypothetical protein